eukprot:1840399-Rhodomonas_salina.1
MQSRTRIARGRGQRKERGGPADSEETCMQEEGVGCLNSVLAAGYEPVRCTLPLCLTESSRLGGQMNEKLIGEIERREERERENKRSLPHLGLPMPVDIVQV